MEKKGFFKLPKLKAILLCITLICIIIIFLPPVMSAVTAGGTGIHCILSCILMCLCPVFIFIDFIIVKNNDGEGK